ncbi:hypothetical protein RHMOL_Rhmol11G0043100 [Rhododendron molle]|uniref:Uncharacterized protein n=1 Tax=Rhododendron molle TaxID=49168 RepID=A0ACC0LNR1_RHOML|nr:hypothetical protein RHMOL_Rhmol11G0043100 [Rhododendron molle]
MGDSKLIILQASEEYALKEPSLVPYRATVQRLVGRFEAVNIIHRPRSDKRFPDALAMLGAKTEFDEEKMTIEILKSIEPSIIDELGARCQEDWCDPILKQLVSGKGTLPIAEVAQFTVLFGELYYRGPQVEPECCLMEELDWRQEYIDFLCEGALPLDPKEAGRVQRCY